MKQKNAVKSHRIITAIFVTLVRLKKVTTRYIYSHGNMNPQQMATKKCQKMPQHIPVTFVVDVTKTEPDYGDINKNAKIMPTILQLL